MEILVFILFLVVAIASNKGKREAKQARKEARGTVPPAYAPPPTAMDTLPDAAFDWPKQRPTFEGRAPAGGSLGYDSPEGLGSLDSTNSASLEGMHGSLEGDSILGEPSRSSFTHVVRASSEGNHSHVESSLTGNIPCPPVSKSSTSARAVHQPDARGLALDLAGVRQGIIYAEILGKPRALQAHGRR